MSSSMLSGERRWASTKRGGMTVLGKVVVPKPINLPSQRSENHGLDPNVEIVPKGTLTWGNKPSSAWGSVSPNTDGGSPSHLSGRPSSGSGTRPSTASSDRALDLTTNSRPASASGALTSNQSSLASLRPRSAETRPGSSQLSRFAENSEHPGAWNAAGTAEKSGGTSTKNDGFSLTSVDFPTLGSGKDSSGKSTDPDASSYGRPGSSSGGAGAVKDRIGASGAGDVSTSENVKNDTVNSWKRDNPPHTDDGGRPGTEQWQGNPHTYPGPPQHYDAWHGAPVNNPQGGVWFKRPPGPAYGNPVGPAGYPLEPFPYYRPQIPAAGLPNSQPVPPPGAGPRGPHPKNGDMFRPHMPDAYVRPGMPVRPGFYPGPVAYEGYYNPPMGYRGPNERDVPYMGMPAGPPVYHRYPVQGASEPGNPHGKSGGYGPTNQSLVGEQAEYGHTQDKRGPYKVLLKQHDGWDRKNGEQRGEGVVTNNERGDQPRPSWEDDWRPERNKEGERDLRKPISEEANFQTYDNQGSVSVPAKMKSPGRRRNVKAVDDIPGKKFESESFIPSKDPQPLPAAPKDSSLIQKIEGLNAKARASDGDNETMITPNSEKQKNKFQANTKANQHPKEPGGGSLHPERTTTAVVNTIPREGGPYGGDKNLDSTASAGGNISRRPTHAMQSRADHHGRGRLNNVELEGWQNKPLISQPPVLVQAVHVGTSNIHVQDHHRSVETTESSGPRPHGKPEGQPMLPMFDRSDSQEQRAKMKEQAKQRTKQLQEEEEDRTKRQMEKAWAKLEELNRRTQAVEESTQKQENVSSDVVQNKQEEYQILSESSKAGRRNGHQSSKRGMVAPKNENVTVGVDKPCLPSSGPSSEAPKSACIEPQVLAAQSAPSQQGAKVANVTHHDNASQVHESNVSKPKRASFKQKHPTSTTEAPMSQADVEDNVTASTGIVANEIVQRGGANLPVNSNAGAETSTQPRKKNSKNGKNKHNKDKSASSSSKENPASVSLETGQPKALSENQPDPSATVQVQTDSRDVDRPSEQHLPQNEDSHGRGNSHWKPQQQSRRMPRNQQNNRPGEKCHGGDAVVWAPVRSQNKAEVTDEPSPQNVVDEVSPPAKPDTQVQNSSKNKRAEMERYVPKPVAKEMAQQGGNNHHPVAPVANANQTTAVDDSRARAGINNTVPQVSEDTHNAGVTAGKTGLSSESRSGNNRHGKHHGKAQGSWRQRGPSESTVAHALQDGSSYSSNVSQHVQKSSEPPQPQKPDATIVKEQEKYSDGWNDWGIPEEYVEPVPIPPPVKDQGVTSWGKRHSSKGHRGSGNTRDPDQKKSYSDDVDKNHNQSSFPETSQIDQSVASKENRGVGERSLPHWQPKPQAVPTNKQRGNRHNSSQNVGSEVASWANKPESNQRDWASPPPTHNQPHRNQSISDRSNAEQAPNPRHQEPRRERKAAQPKEQPTHLPNQEPPNPVETAPENVDRRQDQRMSSGFRKNGNQNACFSQSHEAGDWNYYSGPDNNRRHNNPPPQNRDRPRQNSCYEYQPVGPYNNMSDNCAGPKDGAENISGSRGRGRGQNHSRRGGGGNSYGRQSGNRVEAIYE